MGRKPLQLAGKRFGRWTVLEFADRDGPGKTRWRCRCECGYVGIVPLHTLRRGLKQGCTKCAKLAKSEYQTIAQLRAAGVKQADIARQLQVSRQYVGSVVDMLESRPRNPRSTTHCRRGHRYTNANTSVDKHGIRRCRECYRTAHRTWRLRFREAQIRTELWPPPPKPPKPPATHCKRGHPFTPENLLLAIVNGRQRRRCKTCAYSARRARLASGKRY